MLGQPSDNGKPVSQAHPPPPSPPSHRRQSAFLSSLAGNLLEGIFSLKFQCLDLQICPASTRPKNLPLNKFLVIAIFFTKTLVSLSAFLQQLYTAKLTINCSKHWVYLLSPHHVCACVCTRVRVCVHAYVCVCICAPVRARAHACVVYSVYGRHVSFVLILLLLVLFLFAAGRPGAHAGNQICQNTFLPSYLTLSALNNTLFTMYPNQSSAVKPSN